MIAPGAPRRCELVGGVVAVIATIGGGAREAPGVAPAKVAAEAPSAVFSSLLDSFRGVLPGRTGTGVSAPREPRLSPPLVGAPGCATSALLPGLLTPDPFAAALVEAAAPEPAGRLGASAVISTIGAEASVAKTGVPDAAPAVPARRPSVSSPGRRSASPGTPVPTSMAALSRSLSLLFVLASSRPSVPF